MKLDPTFDTSHAAKQIGPIMPQKLFSIFLMTSVSLGLAACNSTNTNPFITNSAGQNTQTDDANTDTTTDTGTSTVDPDDYADTNTSNGTNTGIEGTGAPGDIPVTSSPTVNNGIVTMAGEATAYRYDAANDYLYVVNLPFDGTRDDPYIRVEPYPMSNGHGRYKAIRVVEDPNTGQEIIQDPYQAVYGVSASGGSEYVVVRTQNYIDEGYYGYVLQRNNFDDAGNDMLLIMPTQGQAAYSGDYHGFRVFEGMSGMELVTGKATLSIDFDDFQHNPAVAFNIVDRRIFDVEGNNITTDYPHYNAVVDGTSVAYHTDFYSEIGENLNPDGTIEQGLVNSNLEKFEGTHYGILSGAEASEVVGVIRSQHEHPLDNTITIIENGGYIADRTAFD